MQILKALTNLKMKMAQLTQFERKRATNFNLCAVEYDILSPFVSHLFSHFGANGVVWFVNEMLILFKLYLNCI